MILLRVWLILALSVAAPLHSIADKEATEDDIPSADIVKVEGMVVHNHTSHNRDAKHVFHGGNIIFSGSIDSTGNHAHMNIGSISSSSASQESHHELQGIGEDALLCSFNDNLLAVGKIDSENPNPVDTNQAFIWKDNVIPYYFTSTTDKDKALFRSVMDIVEEKTCFVFQEKTRAEYEDRHSLEIVTGSDSCETVCRGYVGQVTDFERLRLTSVTQVSDIDDCKKQCEGFVLHELMHAMGVGHTFVRSDRDKFITVNENVENEKVEFLFKKCDDCKLYDEIPYDCNSIMNYGTHISGVEIMKPKDPNTCSLKEEPNFFYGPIGSDLDWKLLNIIGKCSGVLIKKLRVAIQQMADQLQKLQDTNILRDEEELQDTNISTEEEELESKMTEITKYLKDECVGVDGICEAKQIKILIGELLSKFKKIDKTGKVSSGFLNTFGIKKITLDEAAEEVLKKWTTSACFPDKFNTDACNCNDGSGEKSLCNAGEKCTTTGTCLPACTSGEINSADCACKPTGDPCSVDQGCTQHGACLNVCSPGENPLSMDCLCENAWKDTVLCSKGQVCKDGMCLKGEGDPEFCEAVDCSLAGSEEFCPIKCSQYKFCKVVDCSLPRSQEFCPFKCAPVCTPSLEVLDVDCICKSKNGPEPCRRGNACVEEGCLKDLQHLIFLAVALG